MSASLTTAQQYLDKGLVFYNKGWLDEAISSYRMAIQMREGTFSRAHYQLARALLDAGDIGGAIEAFRTSIEQQPENRKPTTASPDACSPGEYGELLMLIAKAIEQRGGNHPWACHNLGIALLGAADFDDAITSLTCGRTAQRRFSEGLAQPRIGACSAR